MQRPSAAEAPRDPVRPWVAAAAVALLLLHATLAIGALWTTSPTYDEVSHLPAGLAIVASGEVRLNPEHPPLVKELAGLAASALRPRLPLGGAAYAERNQWQFGREVVYLTGNDPMALVRAGRLPVVALSLLAAAITFVWARQRFGDGGALFALALYAGSPTVLAHAGLVTTDLGATLGVVATMWLWWRATRRRRDGDDGGVPLVSLQSLLPYALCGLALGVALAAKFSALLLPPLMLACDLLAHLGPDDAPHPLRERELRRRLVGWMVIAGAAVVVLQLVYLSPTGPLRYLRDSRLLYGDHLAGYRFYLAGELGRWFPGYFVVATAVKTTPVELLAMIGGLAVAWLRRRERWRDDLYLWLPALGWIAAMSWLAVGIGVRYVLPAYSLLFVLAGGAVPELLRRLRGRWLAPALLATLALAHLSEAVAAYPGYLSYFNRVAGGSEAGSRWLDDSNLDWGQSLYRLPGWLSARGIRQARVLPAGLPTLPLQSHDVTLAPMEASDWRHPRPGAYVVSAHQLVRGLERAERGEPTDWLRRYRPADTFDGSMYLYVFPAAAEPPPDPHRVNRR